MRRWRSMWLENEFTLKALDLKAQGREAHPGKESLPSLDLEGIVSLCLCDLDRTPSAYCIDDHFPRVRSLRSRPWALRSNAFGVKSLETSKPKRTGKATPEGSAPYATPRPEQIRPAF